MSDPARRRATYDDVLAAPRQLIAELLRGTLVTSPRPAGRHAFLSSTLHTDIAGPFMRSRGGPGGWWIIFEPELHLGEDVLVPDLAGWQRERLPEYPAGPFVELSPDWVCEVLSPSTEARDRTDKLEIYAEADVTWVWLLDPVLRILEVYERRERHWLLRSSHRDDALVRVPPFDAIELQLADLWLAPADPP